MAMAGLIVVAVLNVIFTRISFSVNIAKTSKVYFCERKDHEIKEISDGNPTTYYKSEARCSPNPFFDVIFDGEYYIQYVIARESRTSSEHRGEMDGFLVDLTMGDARQKQVCGAYPSYLQNPYKPDKYRVNCKQPNKLSNGLYIKFAIDSIKEIADIEAHSIVSEKPEDPLALYRGCFAKFSGSPSLLESWTACLRDCRLSNYAFAGIKGGTMCSCSQKIFPETELATAKCDVNCNATAEGVVYRCGSADYFTVYRVYLYLPTYYQCVKYADMLATLDKENKPHPIRVLHNDKNMTIYKCMKYCENVTYAILLNGSTCECCDNDISATLSMDTSCNMPCTGNHEDLCGGYNFTSIYTTCTNRIYMPCSTSLRCNRPMDKYGDCMNDCEYGFTGENCAGRDLKIDVKRDCEIDKPCAGKHNVRCVLQKTAVDCICLDGFSMHSGGHCEDIDECEIAKCDFQTSTCLNMIGSYYCECRDGTYRETNFSCLDNSTDTDGWSFFDGLLLLILPVLSSAATVGVYTFILHPQGVGAGP